MEDGTYFTVDLLEKDIVKDRSTPTKFVESNGAIFVGSGITREFNPTYISFASICAYIQSNLILYDFTGGNKTPIFWFNDSIYRINSGIINKANGGDFLDQLNKNPDAEVVNYKYFHDNNVGNVNPYAWEDKTYIFTFPGHFSARPDICVIPI